MCAAELRDPETGEPIQKATEVWFSSNHFARTLGDLRCPRDHKHGVLQGRYRGDNQTDLARVWTWKFATRVAAGVAAIIRDYHRTHHVRAYAQDEVENEDEEAVGPLDDQDSPQTTLEYRRSICPPLADRSRNRPRDWPCQLCRNGAHKHHIRHSRDEDCKWNPITSPNYEQKFFDCESCIAGHHRQQGRHSFRIDHCMYGGARDRLPNERREGHPQDARRPGRQESTQQLRLDSASAEQHTGLIPLNVDNTGLGSVKEEPPSPRQEGQSSSASGAPLPRPLHRTRVVNG